MSHGTTDGATLGIMVATGEGGTIRSATGDTGDGAILGITEDTGEDIIHGTRTMQDGMVVSGLIGAMSIMEEQVWDMEDISAPTPITVLDTRPR